MMKCLRDFSVVLPDKVVLSDNGAADLERKGINGYYAWVGYQHPASGRSLPKMLPIIRNVAYDIAEEFEDRFGGEAHIDDFTKSTDMYRVWVEMPSDVSSSKRIFTKYPQGYIKASKDIFAYGKCIGYGVSYTNSAIYGVLVFSDIYEAEQAYDGIRNIQHIYDDTKYNSIIDDIFSTAIEDIVDIDYENIISVDGERIYQYHDDEFIILVNTSDVDVFI